MLMYVNSLFTIFTNFGTVNVKSIFYNFVFVCTNFSRFGELNNFCGKITTKEKASMSVRAFMSVLTKVSVKQNISLIFLNLKPQSKKFKIFEKKIIFKEKLTERSKFKLPYRVLRRIIPFLSFKAFQKFIKHLRKLMDARTLKDAR